MDATADSERTPAPGGEVPPGTGGGTDDGAAVPAGSDGAPSGDAPAGAASGSRTALGRSVAAVRPTPAAGTAALVFDDPLDRPSADDTDRGWGELPTGSADDDFTRFLREKPPHHL